MITFTLSGSTDRTQAFLKKMQAPDVFSGLDSLAQRGVAALQAATPKDSGLTAYSWTYEIDIKPGAYVVINWKNPYVEGGNVPIAMLIQFGHGTGNGGYISGRDYINPAIQPIFDEIASEVWKKVTSA